MACLLSSISGLDSTLNLVGTEASCTDVDMAGRTVNDCLNALYVGLPCTVGTSVGMGDFNAERYTLAANIALCQLLHLQSSGKSSENHGAKDAAMYNTKYFGEMQEKKCKILYFFHKTCPVVAKRNKMDYNNKNERNFHEMREMLCR